MHKKMALTLSLLMIIGCGGGGGGGGNNNTPLVSQTPNPPVAPPSLSFDELKEQYEGYYEYQSQWGLNMINASSAYARGATGAGITIGITDSGLDLNHPEIDTQRISNDSATCNDGDNCFVGNYQPTTDDLRHGTIVAGIAAGDLSKGNSGMHGVAFDAEVLFVAIELSSPPDDYDPVDIGTDDGSGNITDAPDNLAGIDNFFSQLFDIYNDYDADIVNNSYGYSGNLNDFTEALVRNAFPDTIQVMSQLGVPDTDKTIYVWAAGNAGQYADQGVDFSSPEILPGMAYYIPEISGHSIAVVSIDEDGQISSFSNRCGVSQDYCIAAPGNNITVPYPTSTSDTGFLSSNVNDDNYSDCLTDNSCYAIGAAGTSFAAPFVSGGLAVMAEYFEGQLGSHEIVNRLFSTANKDGIYADKTVYGQGLMDLDAATSPVGQLSAMMSLSLSGAMVPATFSTLQLTSPSYGDAITKGIGNHSVILFDELEAPFRQSLGSLTSDYRNQIINMDGFEINQQSLSHSVFNDQYEFEISTLSDDKFLQELVTPSYLLNTRSEKNQFFSYYNHSNNSFLSFGLNGSWAMGVFQDSELRQKKNLRSQFTNPWLNFSAAGTTFGSILKGKNSFDIAIAVSSGRNKFNANEIFGARDSSTIAVIELQPHSKMPSIQVGLMKENDASLGLSGSGAFNGSKNQLTSFFGLSNSLDTAGGKLFGSFYWGKSNSISNETGMIQSLSNLYSSAFGIGFLKSSILNNRDSFVITIDQPIRLESGKMQLNIPTFRTKEKNVLFNSVNFNLDPSGREIHSKAQYFSYYKNIGLTLTLGYKSDPYHIKFMDDYLYTSVGFNINF